MSHAALAMPPEPDTGLIRASQGTVGDAASPAALSRLQKALAAGKGRAADRKKLKAQQGVLGQLNLALAHLRQHDFKAATEKAMAALRLDERSGIAWHILAIAQEKSGRVAQALTAYEAAMKLLPAEADVAQDLSRLAQRLGYLDIADKLLVHYLNAHPGHLEATNNLASVRRDQSRYEEAVEILRARIETEPQHAILWNTLGTVMSDQGQSATAVTFFDEALRLKPDFAKARYNRGNARQPLGDLDGALQDVEAAREGADPGFERAMMDMSRALLLLSMGRLGEGFDAYEVRLNPAMPDAMQVLADAPRWDGQSSLKGRRVLVVGEQGLADEVLLGTVLPDLMAELGADGRMYLAVEKRLIGMFQRTFPDAIVGAHRAVRHEGRLTRFAPFMKEHEPVDCWLPLGQLCTRYRREIGAFPAEAGYLKADPERVAYWKAELDALGPELKVGVHWKSLVLRGVRARYFSAFQRWAPVLTTPGCRFINLQCGDTEADLAEAKAAGVELWTPPFDLKDDLEDLAAISVAADVVVGPGIAGVNIAAAVGAETWMITAPDDWHLLGTDHYPFYPRQTNIQAGAFGIWDGALATVSERLAVRVSGR